MPDFGKYVSRLPPDTDPRLAASLSDVHRDLVGELAPIEAKLDKIVLVTDYGAKADGTTNDAAAVSAAEADSDFIGVPSNTKVSTAASALTGVFTGPAQIIDGSSNKRGRYFSQLTSALSSYGDPDGIDTAFNGDLSKCIFPIECRITGGMETPTGTQFINRPEHSPFFLKMYTDQGQTTEAGGGNQVNALFIETTDASTAGGGICGIWIRGAVTGTKSSATDALLSTASILIAGQNNSLADGVYLNTMEFQNVDNGFDVSCVGMMMRMNRTNNTGAKNAFWNAFRAANEGSVASDVVMHVSGSWFYGLDFTGATIDTNGAAIALKADQRMSFNATAGTYFAGFRGNSTIRYSSAASKIIIEVDGTDAAQFDTNGSIYLPSGGSMLINGQQVVFGRRTGWTAPTGTSTRTGFATSTVTLQQLAEHVKALLEDLGSTSGHGLINV